MASSTTKRSVMGLWQVGYYVLKAFRVGCCRLLCLLLKSYLNSKSPHFEGLLLQVCLLFLLLGLLVDLVLGLLAFDIVDASL